MEESSSESILVLENGMYIANGNMKVTGNLEVENCLTSKEFKVIENDNTVFNTSGQAISFKKSCQFLKPVKFNNGRTVIGMEGTYNTACVGSQTIQAGERLVIGEYLMQIVAASKKVLAETFSFYVKELDGTNVKSKKVVTDLIESKVLKVTEDIIGQNVYADVIKTNQLYIDTFSCLSSNVSQTLTANDLSVTGSAQIANGLTITGKGLTGNGLMVKGGPIVAYKGVVAHTGKSSFQSLQIMGTSGENQTAFHVSKGASTLFEGNVTVEDSNLVLDNSKLVTDNLLITPLGGSSNFAETTTGVQITTASDWDSYSDAMVDEIDSERAFAQNGEYNPYESVQDAMDRCERNYRETRETVKTLVNPITYLMEKKDANVPSMFTVNDGIYRFDSAGNALMKNVVSQKGRFADLEAYKFKVNQLYLDKLVTTSVASNVVHTDNLLKSEGIAEFDGSVNSKADIFLEDGSKVNVAENAKVTFQCNSSLILKPGSKFVMNNDTKVTMAGETEIDLDKLVFLDSKTGRRYRISFRDAQNCEGSGIVMDYERIQDSASTTQDVVDTTERNAFDLDDKLKSLGI